MRTRPGGGTSVRGSIPAVTYLTSHEASALIQAPDRKHWEGRRDHAMFTLAVHAGLRVSELIGMDCGDVVFGTGAHVRCHGKGRICRLRHMRPYVAARTMLRRALGSTSVGGERAGLL